MNTPLNPCEESDDYNFQNCIYAKIISKIGCQPYWLDHIKTGIKNCSKASQLDFFLRKMGVLILISTEKELTDEYECLNPCNYMEYKVYDFKLREIPKYLLSHILHNVPEKISFECIFKYILGD